MLKKTFTNAGHIDAKVIDFSEICQKKTSEIGCFLLIVSWRSFPRNFSWNRPIFLRNSWEIVCPWKSFENWLFSAKIPRNRPIVPRILTFFPWKSREIGRFFHEFCFFLREISEALTKRDPWLFYTPPTSCIYVAPCEKPAIYSIPFPPSIPIILQATYLSQAPRCSAIHIFFKGGPIQLISL